MFFEKKKTANKTTHEQSPNTIHRLFQGGERSFFNNTIYPKKYAQFFYSDLTAAQFSMSYSIQAIIPIAKVT